MDLGVFLTEFLSSQGFQVAFAPNVERLTRDIKKTTVVISPERISSSIKMTIGTSPSIWRIRRSVNILLWDENYNDLAMRAKSVASVVSQLNDDPDLKYQISSISLEYGVDPEASLFYAVITVDVEEYGNEPFA